MPTAGHLLYIYTARLNMQETGITQPSDEIKAQTKALVEELEKLSSSDEIEILIEGNNAVFQLADGRVLIRMSDGASSDESDLSLVKSAHQYSSRHRATLREYKECACFHCTAFFDVSEIQDWVDDNDTALCPKCNIDAVLPRIDRFPWTVGFLENMRRYWF